MKSDENRNDRLGEGYLWAKRTKKERDKVNKESCFQYAQFEARYPENDKSRCCGMHEGKPSALS